MGARLERKKKDLFADKLFTWQIIFSNTIIGTNKVTLSGHCTKINYIFID